MSKWLLRGLVFAALMVFVRLVQGAAINAWETKALLISVTLVVLFAIAAFVWGFIDGRSDARANPDPDRRDDLAMTWLLAGLFAGHRQRRDRVADLAVLQGPLCRWADQRAHHLRGVHRAAGLPRRDRRRRARPLAHRPPRRRRAASAPRPRAPPTRTAPTPTCSPLCVTRTRRRRDDRPSAARNRPNPARPGSAARAGSPAHRARR